MAGALADYYAQAIGNTGRWDGMFFDRYCGRYVAAAPAEHHTCARATRACRVRRGMARRHRHTCGPRAPQRRRAPVLIGNGARRQYAAYNDWMREFPINAAPGGEHIHRPGIRPTCGVPRAGVQRLVSWVTILSQPTRARMRAACGTAWAPPRWGTATARSTRPISTCPRTTNRGGTTSMRSICRRGGPRTIARTPAGWGTRWARTTRCSGPGMTTTTRSTILASRRISCRGA